MKCQLIVSHGEYHVCHQNDTYRVLRAIWVKMNLRNSKDPYWERKKPILFQGNGVTTVFLFQILHVYNLYNIFRMIGEDLICIYQTFKMKIKRDKQGFKRGHVSLQNNRKPFKRTAVWEYLRLVLDSIILSIKSNYEKRKKNHVDYIIMSNTTINNHQNQISLLFINRFSSYLFLNVSRIYDVVKANLIQCFN